MKGYRFFLTFFLILFLFDISLAQLNWEQTKGPYGGLAYDIKFDKSGKLYVGTKAGVYTSQDLGENWTKIRNVEEREIFIHPNGNIYYGNYQIDSKGILYNKSSNWIYISRDTAKSWKQFASFAKTIRSFFLLNDKTFFVSADSGCYSTSDSGKTWKYGNLISTTPQLLYLTKFAKDSKNNIYLIGTWDLFKSSDTGITWDKVQMPPASGYNFYSIFINSKDEIFIGASGGIYYSSDYGNSFKNIYSTWEQFSGFCEDTNNNFFCATRSQGVYKYERMNNVMIVKNKGVMANNIDFFDRIDGNIICTAWDCGHFRSSDNGVTWTKLNNPGYYKITLTENGKIFACGDGVIFYSTDLGTTWQTINLRSNKDHVSELVVKGNTIIAILDYQTVNNEYFNDIIKSEDFGNTWTKVHTIKGHPIWNTMKLIDDQSIYLAFGMDLYYSNDLGSNWKFLRSFAQPIITFSKSPWGNIYIGGWSGLYIKNIDDWDNISVPWNSPIVWQVSFASKGEMFVLGFDLYASNDKGKTFQLVTNKAYDVAKNFYIDEERGKIFLGTQERGLFVKNYSFSSVTIPTSSILYNNFPNPFNNQTSIEFFLNDLGESKIDFYNSIGQKVDEIVINPNTLGYYKINWQPKNLSSGIYFYRLQTPSFSETKKMILLK